MRKNKKLIDKATISNIAYLMYHLEAGNESPDEKYEDLIHNDLSKLNGQLHSKLEYEEAEEIFNMVIDYGEHQGEKCFEEGVQIGIKLTKEISKI